MNLALRRAHGPRAVLVVLDVLLLFFDPSLLPTPLLVEVLPDLQPIRQANTKANASTQLVSFIGCTSIDSASDERGLYRPVPTFLSTIRAV